jgi:hypothetical protein
VIAIDEHGTTTARTGPALADRSVEVLGGRNLESLHPRRQRGLVIGFDDQVHVVVLDAEVHDAKVFATSGRERGLANCAIDAAPT